MEGHRLTSLHVLVAKHAAWGGRRLTPLHVLVAGETKTCNLGLPPAYPLACLGHIADCFAGNHFFQNQDMQ